MMKPRLVWLSTSSPEGVKGEPFFRRIALGCVGWEAQVLG